jgi:serine/threonine-protein kinase
MPPPGTEQHPDLLHPGTVVNGFRLLRHVATGSYGSVWQAESLKRPGRRLALKFSLHAPGEGSVGDARAVREVHLLLRAAHENTVRMVAHGRWEDPVEGLHYSVLEWVEGGTLGQWAQATRPSTRQVVRLLQKVARALQRAHEAGVVHRDVKPDNVLVRAADGEPFLSDFGVGDAQGAPTLTAGALPPGTLAFHSPQLLANHLPGATIYRAQPADDWYALGVLLYQLLTGVRPYPDEDQAQVLAQWVVRCEPVAPHQLNPRVPRALGQVALKLLSAEPHLRYPNGEALCAALEQALASAAEPDASLPPPAAPPDAVPTQPPSLSDGPPGRDEEILKDHAFKEEEDPDELRLEQLADLRDTLLRQPRQRRPPLALRRAAFLARQPQWRAVAATVLLAGLALGLWPLRHKPGTHFVLPPAAPPAPQAPPPVAALPASPDLAPLDASPPKEGNTVKTPQSPRPLKSSPSKTALCAAGMAVAGCASVPVRATQQECPRAAIKAMEQREWDWFILFLKPENTKPGTLVTLRPGPLISLGRSGFQDAPKGSLLHGHVYFAEDGRVVVRYTEVELENGERVPVCFAIVDPEQVVTLDDIVSRTEESVMTRTDQAARAMRVLPD